MHSFFFCQFSFIPTHFCSFSLKLLNHNAVFFMFEHIAPQFNWTIRWIRNKKKVLTEDEVRSEKQNSDWIEKSVKNGSTELGMCKTRYRDITKDDKNKNDLRCERSEWDGREKKIIFSTFNNEKKATFN